MFVLYIYIYICLLVSPPFLLFFIIVFNTNSLFIDFKGVSITQPDKVHLQETSDPDWVNVMPLLEELRTAFGAHEKEFNNLLQQAVEEGKLTTQALAYLQELSDCVTMLANRAKHVRILDYPLVFILIFNFFVVIFFKYIYMNSRVTL